MDVKEVYQHESKDIDSKIFKLENGFLVIKHSNSQTQKLNIDQWEEINYIPDNYYLVDRKLNKGEKKEIEKYIARRSDSSRARSLPGKLIDRVKNIFTKER